MEQADHPAAARLAERVARRLDRPVVLVGMMGTGKTSVGRRLAVALGLDFTDADEEIERAARLTIAEMFERHGEAYFRDGERRVIARLIAANRQGVIATGGGAFCHAETRALILARAVAVWLDADLDTLVERTRRRGNRPLLAGGDARATLERLRRERAACYAEAPVHVTSGPGAQQRTLARVLAGIDAWQEARA